jgi:hypothetical protein
MSLFVPPRAQYADTNGNPLAGAKLFFYLTGTSTPQDTYTDSGLTTTNANPVIADASGIFGSIYLSTSNDYKVILKNSSDTTIWTVDPYLASVGSGRTAVADANYTASLNDRVIAYTSLTANRVVTLPEALTFPAGTRLTIVDESGNATPSTKLIQVAPAGSDTIDGAAGTREAVATAYGSREFWSNGDAGWFMLDRDLPERGHIAGLTLSTAGSSTTFSVAAGQCADKNAAMMMTLAAAMSKTTGAWSAGTGNGSLDTGTIANSTGYHVHLIKTAAGVVDVLTSTSATAPTMPSGYTYARRIGWMKTNGSAQWTSFIQNGDNFKWAAPPGDYNAIPGVTTRENLTLTVPVGVVVFPQLLTQVASGATAGAASLLTSLDEADSAPNQGMNQSFVAGSSANGPTTEVTALHTDTSGRIGRRVNTTDCNLIVNTLGWVDPRGRND